MIDVKELLEEIKASPYEEISITAPHTGVVKYTVRLPEDGSSVPVSGPSGAWREKPGTLVAHLEREKNAKPIFVPQKGSLTELNMAAEGAFVEQGEHLATVRHYLSREEVIELILKQALSLFNAPEKASYYFTPEVDSKVKADARSVSVTPGQEIFIMSRMKRETPLSYTGPEGQIYAVYFKPGESVEAGNPLIGVCPGDQVEQIQEVVAQVRSEWKETEG